MPFQFSQVESCIERLLGNRVSQSAGKHEGAPIPNRLPRRECQPVYRSGEMRIKVMAEKFALYLWMMKRLCVKPFALCLRLKDQFWSLVKPSLHKRRFTRPERFDLTLSYWICGCKMIRVRMWLRSYSNKTETPAS